MENSSLNKAHQILRHAELQLRNKKLEETLTLYDQALELFQESLKCTQNPHAIESVNLQQDRLVRQKIILKLKLEQIKNFQKLNDTHVDGFGLNSHGMTRYIQKTINEKLDKFDQLLNVLGQVDVVDGTQGTTAITGDESNSSADRLSTSCTAPTKSSTAVVDDLKSVTDEIRLLFGRLNTQIDDQAHEIDLLKAKIKHIEASGFKETNIGGLKVCDSSGDASPYLISPYELCPDVLED